MVVSAAAAEVLDGRAVRRYLRRALRDRGGALSSQGERVLAVVGVVPQLADELASIAMRGIDATLLGGWDAVVLIADGRVKPLLGSV